MAKRDLTGAVVVVTGAAGGLGVAIARRFGLDGAQLALVDVDADRLAVAVGELSNALPVVCDLTDPVACENAIEAVVERFGGLDVLINNAGMTHRSAFVDTEPAVIRTVMDVNYLGSVNITKAALPSLIDRRGAIGVVTSVAGFAPVLGRTGYAGSKHALHGLFDTLRAELRPVGVDVTIIAPTFVDTDMQDRALGGDGDIASHPQSRVGRQVTPDDVADRIYRAVERRRRSIVIGSVGRVARVMTAVAPGTYERIMARSLRSELDR
ncbi:MAG: SDR family oxidoreductase [Actinomycetota bacterium]|nr:SDR family oxidoreductase [Actinomycetota bacterium]